MKLAVQKNQFLYRSLDTVKNGVIGDYDQIIFTIGKHNSGLKLRKNIFKNIKNRNYNL